MRYLRFKDVFTLLNLFLSFCAVLLLFEDKLPQASGLLVFNILVLDVVDGMVARATKTSNAFGKHLDSITDFFGSSMIVPFFLYCALKDHDKAFAVAVAFLPLLAGVLREIQGRLEDISVPGYFIGYPRNSAGLILIALINTTFVADFHWYWLVSVFSLLLFWLQLSHAPFVGNDKSMLMRMPRMKFYLSTGAVSLTALFLYGYFWEGVVFFMCFFLISPRVIVDKKIWDEVKTQLDEIKMETAS